MKTYWSRSRATSKGESLVEVGSQGTPGGCSAESSSPTATTFPPDDSGRGLGLAGEADGGRGFRRTGDDILALGACAWKAVKDGISTVEGIEGLK